METGFNNSSLNLETLREFCKREGEIVKYSKGDQMEREGDPTRWFAFVEYGCFKYLTYGISDDKEHVVWFSFKDEIAEHMTSQFHLHYQNLYCATPLERYELLLQRCPRIVQDIAMQDIASYLNITPAYLGKLRKKLLSI